jgi:hypothetical protein
MSRVFISGNALTGEQSKDYPGLFDTVREAQEAVPYEIVNRYTYRKTHIRDTPGERYWHDRCKALQQSNKVIKARLKQAIIECRIYNGTPEIDKIRAILEDVP